MDKRANFPAAGVNSANGTDFTGNTVRKIRQLGKLGIPINNEELKQRIDDYFSFCERENMRPGVEGLAYALGTNRLQLWRWAERDDERGEIIRHAKQAIIVFLEEASQTGHINPVTGIFALKNWAGYQDSVTIEAVRKDDKPVLKASELPKLSDMASVNKTLDDFAKWKNGTSYNSAFEETEE